MMAAAAKTYSEFIAQVFDGQCVCGCFTLLTSTSYFIPLTYMMLWYLILVVSSSDMMTSKALSLMFAANIDDL